MNYDNLKRDISFQYNKIIKEYGSQNKIPRIYCDLDGTLSDFAKQIENVTGGSIDKWAASPYDSKWSPVLDTPRFWETLPWTSDGRRLWNFI